MRVDEAGQQDVRGPLDDFLGCKAQPRLACRRDRNDRSMVDGHGVILEHAAVRLDRNDPAGGDQGIDRFHAKRVEKNGAWRVPKYSPRGRAQRSERVRRSDSLC
jgi:hypothetical protein